MDNELDKLKNKLRELAKRSLNYVPDKKRAELHAFPVELRGYSEATLSLVVHKKLKNAHQQADYMRFLGDKICPKVLASTDDGFFMEYLLPAELNHDSLIVQEQLLKPVWECAPSWISRDTDKLIIPKWAMGPFCTIHGDPTLDNVLMTMEGFLRITDPIPPYWLRKPSIEAVDYGKMLQSLLGWEVVLRGAQLIEYSWPEFMQDYDEARRAVFWAFVAIQRVVNRDMNDRITQWARPLAKELEELCA
jgi:hypothetical protein